MQSTLTVPYDESMRLGQGYNSFLQKPCIVKAVSIDNSVATSSTPNGSSKHVSQVVSYSARFVKRVSEMLRVLNVSSGSTIKSGSDDVGHKSLNIDTTKFSTSDLNAVISVKVTNQTKHLPDDIKFCSIDDAISSERFHEIYGDSYISGFVEGGEFHGLISIRVQDRSKKEEITSSIKRSLSRTNKEEWTLGGDDISDLKSALRETESTIAVVWSGGGDIQPNKGEWSLDSMYGVAATFPSKVAACPQYNAAILTRYEQNPSFLEWVKAKHKPSPPQAALLVPKYDAVHLYAAELLDMYMGYKGHLDLVHMILEDPEGYEKSKSKDAVEPTVVAMVKERKNIRTQMKMIIEVIDKIDKSPHNITKIESEAENKIQAPEIYALDLPVSTNPTSKRSQSALSTALDHLENFPIVSRNDFAHFVPEMERGEPMHVPESVIPMLTEFEKKFATNEVVQNYYRDHIFSAPLGLDGATIEKYITEAKKPRVNERVNWWRVYSARTGNFVSYNTLGASFPQETRWPTKLGFVIRESNRGEDGYIFGMRIMYSDVDESFLHYDSSNTTEFKTWDLQGEIITKVMIAWRKQTAKDDEVFGENTKIQQIGFETNKGRSWNVFPNLKTHTDDKCETVTVPKGRVGLKGVYGWMPWRIGFIWAK